MMRLPVGLSMSLLAFAGCAGLADQPATAEPVQSDAQVAEASVSVPVVVVEERAEKVGASEDPEVEQLREELLRLEVEAQLREQRLSAELAELRAKHEKLSKAYEVALQAQRAELQPLELEKAKLELEQGLETARRAAMSSEADAELAALQKQQNLRAARQEAELSEMKAEAARLQAAEALAAAKRAGELAAKQHELALLQAEYESGQLRQAAALAAKQAEQQQAEAEAAVAASRLQRLDSEARLADVVEADLSYRDEPLVDGVLFISDRRIPLNGPIITGTADYVTQRIHYFNNEDPTKPIFLMIDSSPGGSVMQGYRIVKAIEASKAPVHVVVKSFAASMAAVITTLADHSYAYPNAIILHHQMSAGFRGNMTDLEQTLEILKEWEARLAVPVAAKMGITLEQFKEQMYENAASGDWEEFADKAVELKWVNQIVDEVREEGIRQKPTGEMPRPWYWALLAKDANGRSYVNLPPLEPMDAYLIYNPKRFFRVDGQ